MSVFLYLHTYILSTKIDIHSVSKISTFWGSEDILAHAHNFEGLFES